MPNQTSLVPKNRLRSLLEAKDQLRIAKEQIADLKKKLVEADRAKNVAEWAKDKALKAKEKVEFARAKAEGSKEEAQEEAYDLGVTKTQAALKAQVPGVCRLYCSQVWNEALKQARVEASSDLWRVENVYYPPAIKETTPSSSEVRGVPKGAKATRTVAAAATTAPDEPAKESKPSGATEIGEGQSLEVPLRAVESTTEAQAPHAEELALLVEPFQAVPLGGGSTDLKITSAQLSEDGERSKPLRLALVSFLFWCCCSCCCFYHYYYFYFYFFWNMGVCCNEVLLNEWNFPFPSRITRFFVIVITVSMNPMRESDNICAILVIKP